MKLFHACAFRHRLALATAAFLATGSLSPTTAASAQTPAITVAPIISTITGNGNYSDTGDGGPAASATIAQPAGLAMDPAGNLYIAEYSGNRIRKIDTTGKISTFAGTGTSCPDRTSPCGDGGPATSAPIRFPEAVASDAAGNIYIADNGNNRVRKVDSTGIISTFAGNGTDCYVASCASGSDPKGPLGSATGLAIDPAGNVYIAIASLNIVRKVGTNGIISTVAGTGSRGYSGDGGPATSAGLDGPLSIALDAAGNLYIGDGFSYRVRKVDATGNISTIAGTGTLGYSGDGGPATSANINYIYGIFVDPAGNVYLGQEDNRVRKIDTNGNISTIAGTGTAGFSGDGGPATSATFYYTWGITMDRTGALYVSDQNNSRIRKIQPSIPPFPDTLVGQSSPVQNVYLQINQPLTITGYNIPQAEGGAQEFTIGTISGCPLNTPLAAGAICTIPVTFSPAHPGKRDTPLIVQTDQTINSIPGYKYSFGLVGKGVAPLVALSPGVISTVAGNGSNTFSGDPAAATSAGIPSAMAVSRDVMGNTYIADSATSRVRRIDPTGTIATIAGNGTFSSTGDGGPATSASLKQPLDTATDAAGNLYIADGAGHCIRKIDVNGIISTVAGTGVLGFSGDGGPATSAQLHFPNGIALDSAGNLYIADTNNYRIRKVDVNGTISTIAGIGTLGYSGDGGPASSAQFDSPNRVAFDPAGNLYISDPNSERIRKIDLTGTITNFAGNGTTGFSGDGGPATSAQLNDPDSISSDPAGNLYIVDESNNRIRKVDINGVISTIAGNGTANFSGDGGPATNATLNSPNGVTLDSLGNLYIADTSNYRIRKVSTDTPALVLADTAIGTAGALQSVGVSNIGNGELNLADLSASPNFFLDPSGTCNGAPTLPIGNTCSLAIGFKPVQTGPRTGTATITDDALNVPGSTQLVQLSGNGLPVDTSTLLVLSTSNAIDTSTPVTLTANVTPASATGISFTGTISFYDGAITPANLLGTATISAIGEASITVPSFTAGSHTLIAVYSGDTNFNTSTSASVPLTVSAPPIAVSLISSDNPSAYGQTVRFTATVASPSAGSIQFMIDGAPLGGPVTLTGTTAIFPIGTLEHRTTPYVVTAVYLDGLSHPVATSGALNQSVTPAVLTVTATSASRPYAEPNPSFTYTITGFIGPDTQSVVNGSPEITSTATAGSPVGAYPITASLGTLAATNYIFLLTPGTLTITKATPGVNPQTPGVIASCSPNPSVWGQAVTCTATLPPNATGSVAFTEGPSTLGMGTIVDERASFTSTQLAVATHTITAAYAGDIDYNGASSPSISQVVNKATLSVIATDQQRAYGEPNPPLTSTTSGFVNGDTAAVVTGAPVLTTTATETSPAGAYPINVAQGTLAAANYNFSTIDGTLFVTGSAPLQPDFGISSTTPPQLIPPGASATYTILINSLSTPFTDPVTLSATGLPPGATYTFNPTSVTPGTAGATSSLTISVPAQTAESPIRALTPIALSTLLLPLLWLKRKTKTPTRLLLWLLLTLTTLGAITGCGTGGYFSQTEQTYTITVTGTSGSLAHTTTVTLTVQ